MIVLNSVRKILYYSVLALKLLRIFCIFTSWRVKCRLLWKDAALATLAINFSLSLLFMTFKSTTRTSRDTDRSISEGYS